MNDRDGGTQDVRRARRNLGLGRNKHLNIKTERAQEEFKSDLREENWWNDFRF